MPYACYPRHLIISPRVGCEDISLKFSPLWRRGVCFLQVGLSVVIAHIVTDPDELGPAVAAGEQDHGDSHQVGLGYFLWVGRVGLEHELVPPLGHRAHVDRVQHLVVLLGLGRPHVDDLPLQVLGKVLDTLECDLELNTMKDM